MCITDFPFSFGGPKITKLNMFNFEGPVESFRTEYGVKSLSVEVVSDVDEVIHKYRYTPTHHHPQRHNYTNQINSNLYEFSKTPPIGYVPYKFIWKQSHRNDHYRKPKNSTNIS